MTNIVTSGVAHNDGQLRFGDRLGSWLCRAVCVGVIFVAFYSILAFSSLNFFWPFFFPSADSERGSISQRLVGRGAAPRGSCGTTTRSWGPCSTSGASVAYDAAVVAGDNARVLVLPLMSHVMPWLVLAQLPAFKRCHRLHSPALIAQVARVNTSETAPVSEGEVWRTTTSPLNNPELRPHRPHPSHLLEESPPPTNPFRPSG